MHGWRKESMQEPKTAYLHLYVSHPWIHKTSPQEFAMSIEKVLDRAYARATGGRDGRAVVPEAGLDLKLTKPKELGGGGAIGANPEQLFAAGYSA
jgi:hypothetical protein